MKKIIAITVVILMVITSACKKYFGDVNRDPDNPLEVPAEALLPSIQASLSYALAGDGARLATVLNQQIRGDSRQWAVLQKYIFVGEDVNNLYGNNLYADVLKELKELQRVSQEKELVHYEGIAKVLEAYTLLFVADYWDSSPYSEAFQGIDNLQPKYDTQEQLYAAIFALLKDGREKLSLPVDPDDAPGGEDLLYGGNPASWIGLANFIEARANLRLAKKDNSKYQTALTLIGSGLTEDLVFKYSGGNYGHPMFQFNQQRGDCSLGTKITELLTTLNDPRDALYNQSFDEDNTYITSDFPHKMATLVEQKFIEAECTFQTAGAAAAHPIYLDAINSALASEGISSADITTYVGQSTVDPGSANLTLEHIITQKYLALFLHDETYTDWRRTGFPVLTPNVGTQIPRRFPNSQKELNLNGANVPQATIFSRVGWDN